MNIINIFKFLTIQTLILYYLIINNSNSPTFIKNSIINMILTTSICGSLLFYMNSEKYIVKTKLSKTILIIIDILGHIIPLIYCLYTINNNYKGPMEFNSIIIQYIYIALYLIMTDIKRLYFDISYYQLVLMPLLIHTSIIYLLDKI